jgi:hypothetical protein
MAREVSLQKLTCSRMRSFKTCRKADHYRYQIGLRPIEDGFALRYGQAAHGAVEILENEGIESAVEFCLSASLRTDYDLQQLAAQIRAYYWRWCLYPQPNDPVVEQLIETEQSFCLPLVNPATGAASRTFERAGKKDAKIVLRGFGTTFRETKTTGDSLDDRYWRLLLIDPQVSYYFAAAQDSGDNTDAVLYDVIRKPAMKPLKATPVDKRKYTKDGKLYANLREVDETPHEWGERLLADMIERPDFYLQRRIIPRLEQSIDEFRNEVWDIAKDILQAQNLDRWYRNPSHQNCDFCPYFDFCTGLQQLDTNALPDGWQIVSDMHPELTE